MFKRYACWVALVCLFASPVQALPRDQVLVLGKISTNPKKHYAALKPMVDYIASQLQDLGIREGRVLMARDNRQMIQYLRQGKVDWVGETVFSGLLFEQEAGAEILLRRWKKGVSTYRTVFITRKGSDIQRLEDLRGKTLALEDPGSTSAYFMPMAELLSVGLEVSLLDSPRQRLVPEKVNYVFSRQEINTSIWVYKGVVDAGAYSDLNWKDNEDNPLNLRREMRIFHQTENMPRAVEVVRGDLPAVMKTRIRQLLLQADEDPEAEKALRAYQRTSQFDAFDGEASVGLEEARRLLNMVRGELLR